MNKGQEFNLVQTLIGQCSGASDSRLGVVGPTVEPPMPPAACLRTCLKGDSARIGVDGCTWLRGMASGSFNATALMEGACPRGFEAAARVVRLKGGTGYLLSVSDASRTPDPAESADSALERIDRASRAIETTARLLDENEGLADEVLRSYEQLNLIFDFTQQIASLINTKEIVHALLSRLGETLSANTVLVVNSAGLYRAYDVPNRIWVSDGDLSLLSTDLIDEIEAVRKSRQISVVSSPAARIALGPLSRLDNKTDVVLAIRLQHQDEFTSGDTLMIESILSFGGQIIVNSEIHGRLRRMSIESTRALVAAIDKKDHYTSGHSERVGYLARLVGRRLGLAQNELQILEMSGLLHDVGKIGIPENILCKPGKLTSEEYDIIKKHPRMGYEILKPIASFGEILDGVQYHHENPDGSGYPDGLAGPDIPLFARIIHVVDVFDALTTTRSYRVAFSIDQAREILLKESGEKLDEEVVRIFLTLLLELCEERPEAFAHIFSETSEAAHVET